MTTAANPYLATIVSAERRAELTRMGYHIEDMEEVWGTDWWSGMHRFMHKHGRDFGEPCATADEAWSDLDQYVTMQRDLCIQLRAA